MKIAVTSNGETPDSSVDPRFGRADKFIIYDTDTEELSAVSSSADRDPNERSGVLAADMVCRVGADLVITGRCGPEAYEQLHAAGIRVIVGAQGSVADVLAGFSADDFCNARVPAR